jgi:competence protein ComEC
MKLPGVAITAVFLCGILLGFSPIFARHAPSREFLVVLTALSLLFISLGIFLLKMKSIGLAAGASLLSWLFVGALGACLAEQPRAEDEILSLLDSGRIELKTPLRWHGMLRDEPQRLPWGYGYEIELSGVEYEGALLAARGGLRVNYSAQPNEPPPPDFHAGDHVEILTQARLPQVYRDEGAFDRRAYLQQQGIDLVATLRAPGLLHRVSAASSTVGTELARARRKLRDEIDRLYPGAPNVAGVLRAMLLGDRSFVDRAESTDFQKTGVFHVLVVAGLHVGALAVLLFWAGRRLRLGPMWIAILILGALIAYVAVVEQRPPVLRAALMTAIVVLGGLFFRRLDLLNSAAIAALFLLVAKPQEVKDSSFQLSFLAIGCIAAVGVPWLERTVQPYARALRGWRDVTRDAAHEPKQAQFRLDLRVISRWISGQAPLRAQTVVEDSLIGGIGAAFRVWELFVITMVLQIGMLPLMARDFHRVTLSAPFVNLLAVPLTGAIVPLGFLTLVAGLLVPALGKVIGAPLRWATLLLLRIVAWFAHFPRYSYRIPTPPGWLIAVFFAAAFLVAVTLRFSFRWRKRAAMGGWIAALASAVVIAIFPFPPQRSPGKLELTVLDVGQGDSLFLVFPLGKTMLIDGGGAFLGFPGHEEHFGPDPGEDAVSAYLWTRGFQKLDVVALTHAHQDHIGGLTAVLNNFRVGTLWIGREVSSPALRNLEILAREKKIPILHESRGSSFDWDGVQAEFLWPETAPAKSSAPPENNDSLVLHLEYGQRGFMLPGDAEKQAEKTVLAENTEESVRADVLKVGHHGSKNSTTPEFLAAVHPRVAVISAGADNPYGHPNVELLERLRDANVRILRTDRDGAVHVLTNGYDLKITCFVACPEPVSSSGSRQTKTPDQ